MFYVDDIYALHKEQGVLDDLLKVINDKFKTDTHNLSITRDDNHDYIGMDIDFSGKDHVRITQYDFLEDILNETNKHFGGMNGTSVTPAVSDLFIVDETSPPLSKEQAE